MFINITCVHKNYNIYLSYILYVYKGFYFIQWIYKFIIKYNIDGSGFIVCDIL